MSPPGVPVAAPGAVLPFPPEVWAMAGPPRNATVLTARMPVLAILKVLEIFIITFLLAPEK
jgi:hypothetical protein